MSESYVRFWMKKGIELATWTAQDFRDALNERDRLRAEVTAWKNKYNGSWQTPGAADRDQAVDQLKAENERLRAALEEIYAAGLALYEGDTLKDKHLPPALMPWVGPLGIINRVAYEALGKGRLGRVGRD